MPPGHVRVPDAPGDATALLRYGAVTLPTPKLVPASPSIDLGQYCAYAPLLRAAH